MSKKGQGMSYKEKAALSFIPQEDPPFIQAMKKKMGYKEPAKIEDKFVDEDGPEAEDDDPNKELLRMREEDRPQVVVLNPDTDLTQDELNKALDVQKKEEDDRMIAEGKIVFKKPVKRGAAAEEDESKEKKKREEKKEEKKIESRLLSFGDDEEDE